LIDPVGAFSNAALAASNRPGKQFVRFRKTETGVRAIAPFSASRKRIDEPHFAAVGKTSPASRRTGGSVLKRLPENAG